MSEDKQPLSAFPNGNKTPENMGMTMLDMFAMHAPDPPTYFQRKTEYKLVIKEHAPDSNGKTRTAINEWVPESYEEWIARWRYSFAKAMMKAREE